MESADPGIVRFRAHFDTKAVTVQSTSPSFYRFDLKKELHRVCRIRGKGVVAGTTGMQSR